jgi:hypothetical protein
MSAELLERARVYFIYVDGQPINLGDHIGDLHAKLKETVAAGNRLSFAAQTTGGTAGRDEGLMAAIDAWAAVLAKLDAHLKEHGA